MNNKHKLVWYGENAEGTGICYHTSYKHNKVEIGVKQRDVADDKKKRYPTIEIPEIQQQKMVCYVVS